MAWCPTVADVDDDREEKTMNVFGRTPSIEAKLMAREAERAQIEAERVVIERARQEEEERQREVKKLFEDGESERIRCGFKLYAAVARPHWGSHSDFKLYVDIIGRGNTKIPAHLLLEKVTFEQHRSWWTGRPAVAHHEHSTGPDFEIITGKAYLDGESGIKIHLRFKSATKLRPMVVFLAKFGRNS